MLPEFDFTLPACGKTLKWKPLPVGASIDVTAANVSTPTNLGPALLMRRVVKYDGKEGPPPAQEWRNWEEIDYEAFADEVQEKEGARKAMFRKARAGVDLDAQIKASVAEVQQSLATLGRNLTALLETYEAQKANRDPLG